MMLKQTLLRNLFVCSLLVFPVACSKPISFADKSPRLQGEKKFINTMAVHATKVNEDVLTQRKTLLETFEKQNTVGTVPLRAERKVAAIAERYKITKFDIASKSDQKKLLARVDTVPVSLLLAQAANESAWGTSRFAKEGHNFFGISCDQPGCGLYPNNKPRKGVMQLKTFSSPRESVETYLLTLNTNRHYEALRQKRAELRNSQKSIDSLTLASGLKAYSERGLAYVREIKGLIRSYRLKDFDRG